ncbi:NAD(P)-linked oxidoreductase superfamily protein [Euphorbia peplus]|nr:NAD(P)-linked oxidoreductase superfamily protein [Euphorbia peplus]
MASVPIFSTTTKTTATSTSSLYLHYKLPFPTFLSSKNHHRPMTKLHVSSPANNKPVPITTPSPKPTQETIFFDGGAHYGDLLANLLLGFTLFWLPLTLAAVSRAFNLRYRFSNLRVTVISGLTGEDRSDFSYKVIKDVKVVPRFIGEWGDIIITLKDGTVIDLRSVPRFREIANYCLEMAQLKNNTNIPQLDQTLPKGF